MRVCRGLTDKGRFSSDAAGVKGRGGEGGCRRKGARCTARERNGLGCRQVACRAVTWYPGHRLQGKGLSSIMRPPAGPSVTTRPHSQPGHSWSRIPQATQEGFVRCLNRNGRTEAGWFPEVKWPVHPSGSPCPVPQQRLLSPTARAGGEGTDQLPGSSQKRTAVRLYFSVK